MRGCVIVLATLSCLLGRVLAASSDEIKPLIYIVCSLTICFTFMWCGVLYKRYFPHGCPRLFDDIQLDDIYLEEDESQLEKKISALKQRMTSRKKRKAAYSEQQDIRMLPIERQGLLHRGDDIFDEIGWEETPKKATPQPPPPKSSPSPNRKEAAPQAAAKVETDENMWAQWDKTRTDKQPKPPPGKKPDISMSPTAVASKRRVDAILGHKTIALEEGGGLSPVSPLSPSKGLSLSAQKRMGMKGMGGSNNGIKLQSLPAPTSKKVGNHVRKPPPPRGPPPSKEALEGLSISGGLGQSFSQKAPAASYSINVDRPAISNPSPNPLVKKMIESSKKKSAGLDQSVKNAISIHQKPRHVQPPSSPPPSRGPLSSDMSIQRRPPPPRGPPPPELLSRIVASRQK